MPASTRYPDLLTASQEISNRQWSAAEDDHLVPYLYCASKTEHVTLIYALTFNISVTIPWYLFFPTMPIAASITSGASSALGRKHKSFE